MSRTGRARPNQWTERAGRAAFRFAVPRLGRVYESLSPGLRALSERFDVSGYDDCAASFRGGDMPSLVHLSYEKSLQHLWKSEVLAPWLGIHDASADDRRALAAADHLPSSAIEDVPLETIRDEVERELSPAKRFALCRIMDLIVHGEAYALYTSATLLPEVRGTGAKLGMAMQTMEEAKHFVVLRALMRAIGDVQPLPDTARIMLDTIARQKGHMKLFGMNVLVESLATSIFAQFADYPGLRHVLGAFHTDESRHCGFPKSYFATGVVPEHVTRSLLYRMNRTRIVLSALPVIWEVKPHFDVLGIDAFDLFGRFVSKAGRLAEASGMPLVWPRKELEQRIDLLFNAWRESFEPERFTGWVSYTSLERRERLSPVCAEREAAVFGIA
ncbi:MAG: hypothetical protein IT379_33685 [Deltaproteobacteria bacterium]|nr:hypothetical protein [Deltaproteobacteria bacterium]